VSHALEAELEFYARVFKFDLAEALPQLEIRNLPARIPKLSKRRNSDETL